MEPSQFAVLFIGSFIATFIASLTGGAGLFTIPLMILLGLPPEIALSTNKVGGLGMMSGGLARFKGEKYLDLKLALQLGVIAAVASYFGAHILAYLDSDVLRVCTGAIILVLLPISIFFRSLGLESKETSPKRKSLSYLGFGITSYIGGFFGAGIGVINIFILMICHGKDIISARATSLIPHLLMSACSLIVLAKAGFVNWSVGIVLACSMVAGSYAGTHYGIKKGAKWVKVIFNSMIALMCLKIAFSF